MPSIVERLAAKVRRARAGNLRSEILYPLNRSPARWVVRAAVDAANLRTKGRRRALGRAEIEAAPAAVAPAVDQLRRDGWAPVAAALPPDLLRGLVAAGAALSHDGPASAHRKSYWMRSLDALKQDGLLPPDVPFVRFAMHPAMVAIASAYLGELPFISQVIVTRSRHTGEDYKISQLWHRDHDDVRVLKLFVYLTDVADIGDGPFTFLPPDASARVRAGTLSHIPDARVFATVPEAAVVRMFGGAGTAFMADTSRCYHMGSRLAPGHERLMVTVAYIPAPSIYPGASNWVALPPGAGERERLLLRQS